MAEEVDTDTDEQAVRDAIRDALSSSEGMLKYLGIDNDEIDVDEDLSQRLSSTLINSQIEAVLNLLDKANQAVVDREWTKTAVILARAGQLINATGEAAASFGAQYDPKVVELYEKARGYGLVDEKGNKTGASTQLVMEEGESMDHFLARASSAVRGLVGEDDHVDTKPPAHGQYL